MYDLKEVSHSSEFELKPKVPKPERTKTLDTDSEQIRNIPSRMHELMSPTQKQSANIQFPKVK